MSRLIAAFVLLACALMAALVLYLNSDSVFWGWTKKNINHTKSIGSGIILKIGMFQAENGRLPTRLDELVPKYLTSVPTPTAGVRSWNYNLTGDGDTFYLGFSLPRDATWHGYPSCSYDSKQRSWYLDE